MKKTVFAVMLTACIVLTSDIPFAQGQVKGQQEGGKNYRTIAYVKIEDSKNKIYLTFLRLKPGKIAAIAKLPKKSEAKIEGMSLKSPSGKKYRAETMNMRSRDVVKYLQSAYLRQGFFKTAFFNIDSYFTQEAEANCGRCEKGSGSAPKSSTGGGGSAGIGTGILIDTATADSDPWVNVGTFDVGGESGEGQWIIQIRYSDGGLNIDTGGDVDWFHWDDPGYTEPANLADQWTEFGALFGGGSPVQQTGPPPEFDNFWHGDFDAGSLLGE